MWRDGHLDNVCWFSMVLLTIRAHSTCRWRLECLLRLTAARGKELWTKEVELARGAGWSAFRPDASGWPAGEYRVDLLPRVGGQVWPDGPRLRYRRHSVGKGELLISPVAPWKLERDPRRQQVHIIDFRAEQRKTVGGDAAHWRWIEGQRAGRSELPETETSRPRPWLFVRRCPVTTPFSLRVGCPGNSSRLSRFFPRSR